MLAGLVPPPAEEIIKLCDESQMIYNSYRLIIGLTTIFCLSLPCSSEEWLLLWQDGEKPNRSAFYLATDVRNVLSVEEEIATVTKSRTQEEMDRASELAKTVRVQVMQIYESPDGPYATAYWADFRARDRMCRLENGIHWYRDDRDHSTFSSPNWQPVPNNWQRRAFDMAMSEPAWSKALKPTLALARAGTVPMSQDELVALGTRYVGRYSLPTQLADLTWETFWRDGRRPPWEFSPRSPDQVARERQKTLDYLEWAHAEISRMEAGAVREAQMLEAEQREQERRAEARRRRPPSSLNDQLESWIGVPVEELTARIGEPTSVRQEGTARFLSYSGSRAVPMTQLVLAPNGRDMTTIVVGQDNLWSVITYIIVNGRVYDFVVEGNDPEL